MITAEKLKIYEAFRGDLDIWARAGSDHDKAVITEEHWCQIEQMISAVTLLDRNLPSEEFARRVAARLRENTADDSAAARIRHLATEPVRPNR